MSKISNEKFNKELETKDLEAVEAAERKEDMDEKKEFFDEEKAMESDLENDQEMDPEDEADNDAKSCEELPAVPEKEAGFFGKIFGGIKRWFAKRWKWLVGIGSVLVIGGIVYIYFQGKKVKVGTVEEVAEAIAETEGDNKKVLDFADEAKKLAKEMVKNPENFEVKDI